MAKRRRKITSLKEVRTDEVSLVESGANLKGRFPLMKSVKGTTMEEILVKVLKAEGKSDAIQKLEEMMDKEELPEDAKTAVMAAMKLLESFSDMVPVADALRALRSASGEEAEAEAEAEEVESEYEEKEEEMDKEEHEEEAEKEMDEEEKRLQKSLEALPESSRSVFQDIWKSNQELLAKTRSLQGELGVEIAKRKRREYIAKSEKSLCNIPGHSLEDVVDLVLEAKARDEGLGARVEKALESASNALQGGAVLVEAGRNVPDAEMANDAWSKIQTLAKKLQTASSENGKSITMQAATSQVILSNPELYQQYKAER
jgi:hypothetical protein